MKNYILGFIVLAVIIVVFFAIRSIPVVLPPEPTNSTITTTWTATAIDSPVVQLVLMRLKSSDPINYDLVRVIATTTNTGSYTWTPTTTDIGADIYLEIGCTPVSHECHALPLIGPISTL